MSNKPNENKCCKKCEMDLGNINLGVVKFGCPDPNCECECHQEAKECKCACHENKLKKPYEHDTKCCENMNGFISQEVKEDWEIEFDKEFPCHCGLSPEQYCACPVKLGVIKSFIHSLLS